MILPTPSPPSPFISSFIYRFSLYEGNFQYHYNGSEGKTAEREERERERERKKSFIPFVYITERSPEKRPRNEITIAFHSVSIGK